MVWALVGIAVAAVALWSTRQITLVTRRVGSRARKRKRLRDNAKMGREGEAAAEKLLRKRGYRILKNQTTRNGTFWVDKDPVEFRVRVDFLVSRWWRTYAVEVKTGKSAPSPKNINTRRQLFEYSHLYDVDGLILADMTKGELRDVRFAGRGARHIGWHTVLAGVLVGVLVGVMVDALMRGQPLW